MKMHNLFKLFFTNFCKEWEFMGMHYSILKKHILLAHVPVKAHKLAASVEELVSHERKIVDRKDEV